MNCNNCGSIVTPDSKFCTNCAAAVHADDTPAQAEPAQPAPQEQPDQADAQMSQQPAPQEQQTYQQPQDIAQQSYQQPAQPDVYNQQVYTQPAQPDAYGQYPSYTQPAQQDVYSQQAYTQPVQPDAYGQYPSYTQPAQQDVYNQQAYARPAQPDAYGQQPYQPPPPANPVKNKKAGMIATVISAFVLLGGAAAVYWFFFMGSPEAATANAFSNLGDEFNQRIHGTPLEAFGMLAESLENGSLTVDFDYSDMWSNTYGKFTLLSDAERGDYAIEAGISADGFYVDFDFYINQERAAIRVPLIDNNFYGITFASFRSDFRSFANSLSDSFGYMFGINQQEIDMIGESVGEFVDLISGFMRSSGSPSTIYGEYDRVVSDFLDRVDSSTSSTSITSGGSSVSVTKVEYVITDRMFIEFLEDLLRAAENDENARDIFLAIDEYQAAIDPWYRGSSWDDALRDMRSAIRELDRSLKGNITYALYIGSGDRLMLLEVDADLEFDRERAQFNISLDLGASAHDLWVFKISVDDGRNSTTGIIEWERSESPRGGGFTSLRFIDESRWGDTTSEILLDWTDNGYFTLSFADDYYQETLLNGTYTSNNNGFRLVLDDPFISPYWGESLRIEISTTAQSGPIPQINYINISDWGMTLMDSLEELFNEMFGFGNPPYPPGPDIPEPPPLPAPPPTLPPPPGTSELYYDLIGEWEFSSGNLTYFFWNSGHIEFSPDGIVANYDDNDGGFWYLDGNTLTVELEYGFSYVFTVELVGGRLSITDRDNDTGFFTRRN